MTPDHEPSRLWTIAEAAGYLRLPISAIYKMTAPKARLRIPHVRVGGRLRFRRTDLDRWVSALSVSNIDLLTKATRISRKVSDGDDSSETPR